MLRGVLAWLVITLPAWGLSIFVPGLAGWKWFGAFANWNINAQTFAHPTRQMPHRAALRGETGES